MGSVTALALDWLVDNGGDRDITQAGTSRPPRWKPIYRTQETRSLLAPTGGFGARSRRSDNAEIQQMVSGAWHGQW